MKKNKQRVIRRTLSQNRKFDDMEASDKVASLLKVLIIAMLDWSEGEITVTLSNFMKGLSIFVMRLPAD